MATATSPGEALRLAGEGDFDLILSDISMPGMDGYELLRELRKRPRTARIPAIALTGFGRNEDEEQARAAGLAGHMIKPVVMENCTDPANTGRHRQWVRKGTDSSPHIA